ncbi:MAG: type II secretion system F family protein [Phycisphaerales bacterium]
MPPEAAPNPFFYVAATPMGARKMGVRSAANEPTLSDSLRKEQLLLLRAWKLPAWAQTSDSGGVPTADELAMNDQLATLLPRGVPLTEALDVVASVVKPQTKQRVERIREMVVSGSSFADACNSVGGFDEVTIAVYRAAERAGDLGGAAERLASSARRRLAISRKAVTLMIYPAVVMTISVVVVLGMLSLVVPRIGEAISEAGVELPWFSALVFSVGDWCRGNILWIILALATVVALAVVARKQLGAAMLRTLRVVPAVARLQLAVETTRFFAVMAAMTKSGVPIADSLATTTLSITHPKLRAQLQAMRKKLVEGGLLRTLINEVTALPIATRRLLIAAERGGDLDQAFDTLAGDMAEEVDTRSDRLLALLEPAIIVAMFTIIGTLLLAIMIPLITLSSSAGTQL